MNPRIASEPVGISVEWEAVTTDIDELFALYPKHNSRPVLDIWIRPPGKQTSENTDLMTARYGWFYRAAWEFGPTTHVSLSVDRSLLRAIRPLIDSEMHRVHEDFGRIIHERVLTTFLQMTRAHELTFLHGAAMVTQAGDGVLIGGHGGVGKTSLALEMGRHHGWGFLSDDLALVDVTGKIHLNANRPKIYAYNVTDDPELEELITSDRSAINHVHWKLMKRWPNRVRRSVLPSVLYQRVDRTAPLSYVLLVERGGYPVLTIQHISQETLLRRTIEILVHELRGIAGPIQTFLDSLPIEDRRTFTWDTEVWAHTLRTATSRATLLQVEVPASMEARDYKQEMSNILPSVVGS